MRGRGSCRNCAVGLGGMYHGCRMRGAGEGGASLVDYAGAARPLLCDCMQARPGEEALAEAMSYSKWDYTNVEKVQAQIDADPSAARKLEVRSFHRLAMMCG